jgi:hypothetical protein
MSHHYSGPDSGFPHGDARLDLTDLYAFPKPSEADKSILIMNVHPSAVVNPPGPTTHEPFAPVALYEFKIDTNGDAVADIAYRVRFSSFRDGSQTATLRRVEGAQAAGTGDSGQVIIESAPVSTGRDARVTEADGYRFFAGWRSDPFFFDTRGALNDLQFTGEDFFIDKDVCSIVLEIPNSAIGSKRVGLWARTLDGTGGVWVQADRGALPAQAVFLVGRTGTSPSKRRSSEAAPMRGGVARGDPSTRLEVQPHCFGGSKATVCVVRNAGAALMHRGCGILESVGGAGCSPSPRFVVHASRNKRPQSRS